MKEIHHTRSHRSLLFITRVQSFPLTIRKMFLFAWVEHQILLISPTRYSSSSSKGMKLLVVYDDVSSATFPFSFASALARQTPITTKPQYLWRVRLSIWIIRWINLPDHTARYNRNVPFGDLSLFLYSSSNVSGPIAECRLIFDRTRNNASSTTTKSPLQADWQILRFCGEELKIRAPFSDRLHGINEAISTFLTLQHSRSGGFHEQRSSSPTTSWRAKNPQLREPAEIYHFYRATGLLLPAIIYNRFDGSRLNIY